MNISLIQSGLLLVLSMFTSLSLAAAPTPLFAGQSTESPSDQSAVLKIEASLDKHDALVADPVQFTIEVLAPANVDVQFPALPDQLGELQIAGARETPDLPDGEMRRWVRQIKLESMVPGNFTIPQLEIGFVDRRQINIQTGVQLTPSQTLAIRSTLEGNTDPTSFRDIKSVVFLPEPRQSGRLWLAWAAGAFLLGAAIAVAGLVVTRRHRRNPGPRQMALAALRDLLESQAFGQQDAPQIYLLLTQILRTFVQGQFGIVAPRMTTQEFLDVARGDSRLSPESRHRLSQWLAAADMVKFAGMVPDQNGLGAVIRQMQELIESSDMDNTNEESV